MEQDIQIRGYIDPRTGEYKRTHADADARQVHEDLAFIAAWEFFWDGPEDHMSSPDGLTHHFTRRYDREEWLVSDERVAWLADLSDEQVMMLQQAPPPEEIRPLGDVS